jgi:cobalt-precorrin 5A hydrolase
MAGGVVIVAGFGFRGAATVQSLSDALSTAACGREVQAVATARDKAQTAVFESFAQALGVSVVPLDSPALAAVETVTYSPASQIARGTSSLAEAAALAAAGPGARLIVPRVVSDDRMATCALAETCKEGA